MNALMGKRFYSRAAIVVSMVSACAFGAPPKGEIPLPEEVFRDIPATAKTGASWHWMGSYVTKEAILKDLDWFKEMGIGSVTVFGLADTCAPCSMKFGNSPVKLNTTAGFMPKVHAASSPKLKLKFKPTRADKSSVSPLPVI